VVLRQLQLAVAVRGPQTSLKKQVHWRGEFRGARRKWALARLCWWCFPVSRVRHGHRPRRRQGYVCAQL